MQAIAYQCYQIAPNASVVTSIFEQGHGRGYRISDDIVDSYNKTNKNIHDYPNDDIRGITFAYKYVVLNWGGVCQMLTTCQFCLD